jgi:hypothetical protein
VNLSDFADRPPRALNADEVFSTGAMRFRYRPTPHLPHGWDAGVLFEETGRTLFCSDLFTHNGDVEAITYSDILGRTRESLRDFQAGPLMDYMPYTSKTRPMLQGLASLKPAVLATMHGSSFAGDCSKALLELEKCWAVRGDARARLSSHALARKMGASLRIRDYLIMWDSGISTIPNDAVSSCG